MWCARPRIATSIYGHPAVNNPARPRFTHARRWAADTGLNQFPADRVRDDVESVVRAKLLIDVMEVIPQRLGA